MGGGEAQPRRRTHPHRNPVVMRAGPAHHALDHHGCRVAQQRRGNQLYPLAAPPLIDERAYRTHTDPAQGVFAEVAEQTGSGLDPRGVEKRILDAYQHLSFVEWVAFNH